MSIRVKIVIASIATAVAMAILVATGWLALDRARADFASVYDDRVVPLSELKTVADLYAVDIVDAAHKARNGNQPFARSAETMRAAETHLRDVWARYKATYLVDQERRLAAEAEPLMARGDELTRRLVAALDAGDAGTLDRLVKEDLYRTIDPISAVISKLTQVQLDVAADVNEGFRQRAERADLINAATALLGLAALLFSGWTNVFGVMRPLGRITRCMGLLAAGDRTVAVDATGRRDEIGAMARAVQVFKENAIAMDRLEAEQKEAERRAAEDKRRTIARVAAEFEAGIGGIVGTLSSAATEMETTAATLSSTAEETSRQATAVAAASEEASAGVHTVAGAAEQLSSSVHLISQEAGRSSAFTGKAVADAERTGQLVNGLADAAQRIGAVTALISGIASQTNLLALNATIEAARAGDAGRGFAVVAGEVKALADQTAKATGEISAQIAAMQAATGETVGAIRSIADTIAELNGIATTIAGAIEEQGAATQEIARNVQQAAAGTREVSGNIAGVTRAAEETGAAATQVQGAAGDLSRQAEQLRAQVDRFLAAVGAA